MADDASSTPVRVPHLNSPGATAPFPGYGKPLTARQRRHMLEAALDRLLGAVDGLLADLDALDGDADFEPALGAPERHPAIDTAFDTLASTQAVWAAGGDCEEREEVAEDEGAQCEGGGGDDACEDEGGACEDEGADSDSEPDEATGGAAAVLCNWQDEGDQTTLRPHPITPSRRPPTARSPHENVRGHIRVRAL